MEADRKIYLVLFLLVSGTILFGRDIDNGKKNTPVYEYTYPLRSIFFLPNSEVIVQKRLTNYITPNVFGTVEINDFQNSFFCQVKGNQLDQNYHFSLGIKSAFLKLKGGVVDITSFFLDYHDLTNNCIAYEGALGIGFYAKLGKRLSIQPDITFWEYQVARYSDVKYLTPDLNHFNLNYWYANHLRLTLGFIFGN